MTHLGTAARIATVATLVAGGLTAGILGAAPAFADTYGHCVNGAAVYNAGPLTPVLFDCDPWDDQGGPYVIEIDHLFLKDYAAGQQPPAGGGFTPNPGDGGTGGPPDGGGDHGSDTGAWTMQCDSVGTDQYGEQRGSDCIIYH